MSSRRNFHGGSIRGKLILSFCLLFGLTLALIQTASLFGIPFTDYNGWVKDYKAESLKGLTLIADLKKAALADWLKERTQDARLLAFFIESHDFPQRILSSIAAAQAAGATGEALWRQVAQTPLFQTLESYTTQFQATHMRYARIRVIDAASASTLYSTDASDLGEIVAQQYLQRARGALAGYIGGLDREGPGKQPAMHFCHVIWDSQRAITALLVLDVDPEDILKPLLDTGEGMGASGEIVLVDQDTRILFTPRYPLPNGTRPSPLEFRVTSRAAQLAAHGEEGRVEALDYRGIPVLAVYRHIRISTDQGLGLVVKRDVDELFAKFDRDFIYSLAIGVFGLLLATALIVFIARNLSRPIIALSRTAERISSGDLLARADFANGDEIGQLARTFNGMVERLRDWNTELERQVSARTADLQRSEQTLKASHERFLAVLDGLDAKIYVADLTTHEILFANKSILIEVSDGQEVIGRTCSEVLAYAKALPGEFCATPHVLDDSGAPTGIQSWEFHDTQNNRWFHIQDRAIRWVDDRLVRLEIATDISGLKQTEEALVRAKEAAEAANDAKSEFLANMSHELRTPLNGMLGMLQLIKLSKLDRDQLKYVEVALGSGNSLVRIISDILDLSRIERGVIGLHEDVISLENVITTVGRSLEVEAAQKGIALRYTIDRAVPRQVVGDAERIRQTLFNLAGNAVKFTEKGGVAIDVFLASRCADTLHLLFVVADTGIGIPEDKLDWIFEPFTQVDGSSTRRFGGTGLGLGIVKRLVLAMGGHILVDSRPDHGATFEFTVAVKAATQEDLPLQDAGVSRIFEPLPASLLRRALVVEDEPVNLLTLKLFLEQLGYTVVTVEDGLEAVEAVQRERFDVLLMDIQMPVLDGVEATRRIRALGLQVPIVALTAFAMESDRTFFLAAGMDGYLAKPVDLENLDALLKQLVG